MNAANAMRNGSTPGGNFLTAILIITMLVLFVILLLAGYYYVTACAERKSFWDYLIDMDLQPCLVGATPKQEKEIEKQDYRERKAEREKEVFHIADQIYTFDEAACKCNAVSPGARLATEAEVINAFNAGANWVGYGWTESPPSHGPDAMAKAFFPLQAEEFYKRIDSPGSHKGHLPRDQWFANGVPGVNGGFFRKTNRFGINCFGVRPAGMVAVPNPIPPPTEAQMCKATQPFNVTHKLRSDNIAGFNRTQWSQYD